MQHLRLSKVVVPGLMTQTTGWYTGVAIEFWLGRVIVGTKLPSWFLIRGLEGLLNWREGGGERR
jgi:hypothetical protein